METVNIVGTRASNIGPTLNRICFHPIFVIGQGGVSGGPAFSVKLHSEILVADVTCHQRALTYGSVHVVPVNKKPETCVLCDNARSLDLSLKHPTGSNSGSGSVDQKSRSVIFWQYTNEWMNGFILQGETLSLKASLLDFHAKTWIYKKTLKALKKIS